MTTITSTTTTVTPRDAAPSESKLLGSDPFLELFAIPNSREVHGNTFPLGIRVKREATDLTLDAVVEHIQQLAEKSVLDNLLQNRK